MGRKIALLIGNSRYDDPGLARLETADVDVREIADVLRAREIGEFDEVMELPDQGLAVVRRAIAQFFRQGKRDDLLVFYFSGHGVKDENGQLYLAVKDTELPLLAGTSIEAAFITAQMDGSNSRRQVLILDCCHSGAFARGAKGVEGQSVGIGPAFEGRGYGHIVLTATDSTQYAWEGEQIIGESDKSVFTHYLLQGLKTGEADSNSDGVITIDELYEYVFDHVVKETPKQTPGKWSYKQQGDIVIAQNPSLLRPAPLSLELQALIDSPFSRLRAEAIPELTLLLQGHRGQALAARQALEKLCADDSKRVSAAAEEVLGTVRQPAPIEPGSGAAADEDAGWRAGERTLLRRRGRTAIDEERFADALIDLTQARLLDPQDPEIAGLLQRAQTGQSAFEAEKVQREVARLLAEASQRLANKDFAGALGQVDDALQLDGSSGAGAALKGEIQRHQQVFALVSGAEYAPTHEAAIAALNEALTLNPEHALASQLLAHRTAALEAEAAERVKQREHAARHRIEDLLQRGALDEADQAILQIEAEWGNPSQALADCKAEIKRLRQEEHRKAERAEAGNAALAEDTYRLDPQNAAAQSEKPELPWQLLRSRQMMSGLAVVAVAGLIAYGVWNREVPRESASPPQASPPQESIPQSSPATPPADAPPVVTPSPEPRKEDAASPRIEKTTPQQSQPTVKQREQPKPIPPPAVLIPTAPSGVEIKIQALLTQGDEAVNARKYDDAIVAYDEAARLGSQAGRARAERARVEIERSRSERLSLVRQRLSRAEQLLDAGRYQEALGLVDEALKLDPKSAEATVLRQKVNDAWSFEKNVLR
jgi:tetratricopeptide (TPR) repeat protein